MTTALLATATALWPWLAVLALVSLCAFIRDGQRQVDALIEDPAETEARRVMCEANIAANWRG